MSTIFETLRDLARRKPRKVAIVQGGIFISYDHLFRLVRATEAHLRPVLAKPTQKLVIVSITSQTDALVAALAARSLGFTVIVCPPDNGAIIDRIDGNAGIIVSASENLSATWKSQDPTLNIITLPPHIYSEAHLRRIDVNQKYAARIFGGHVCFSSGSTGIPKLIEYSPEYEAIVARSRISACKITPKSVIHNAGSSLSGSMGWMNHACAIFSGCTIALPDGPDWVRDAFYKQPISHIFINANTISTLIEYSKTQSFLRSDSLVLRVSGGFTSFERLQWLKDNLTTQVLYGMGSTECVALLTSRINSKEDAIWLKPQDGVDIRILGRDGRPLSPGQEGELAVRLKLHYPDRYLSDEELSREKFRNGYLHTGDLAVQRDDGRVRLLGRISETISYPGGKLATGLIEAEISEHLKRPNVFAFSHQNERFEDEVVVCLEGAAEATRDDINWLRGKFGSLSSLIVRSVERFPALPNGKVDRLALRKLILGEREQPDH